MDNWVVALCQNFKQISWEIRQTSVVSFSLPSSGWKAKAVGFQLDWTCILHVHGQVDLYLDRTEKLDFVVWLKALGNNRRSSLFAMCLTCWLRAGFNYLLCLKCLALFGLFMDKTVGRHPHATRPRPLPRPHRPLCIIFAENFWHYLWSSDRNGSAFPGEAYNYTGSNI